MLGKFTFEFTVQIRQETYTKTLLHPLPIFQKTKVPCIDNEYLMSLAKSFLLMLHNEIF